MLAAVVVFATNAFAAEKTKIEIGEAVMVNGHQIPAGDYTVTWDCNGPNVELKFLKGKNVVATVPAEVTKLNAVTSTGSIVTRKDAGSVALTEIRPNGKNYAFELGGETAAQNNSK